MRGIVSCRMSDRVLLCMWWLSITLRSKKSSWRAVVGMRWLEIIYQEVNKSRLTIILIKYRGRERKKEAIFLTVIFINKSELTE